MIRAFLLACLSLYSVIFAEAQLSPHNPVPTPVPADTLIVAQLQTTVLSSFAKPGDPLVFRVLRSVRASNGSIAIPKDAKLLGEVAAVQHGAWRGIFHWTPARISISVHRAEWDGNSLALDADLFGFVRQTDSLATEPARHITSRYDTFTLDHVDFVAVPYNHILDSTTPETSSSSQSVLCNLDGDTGSYSCQSDGYYSSGSGGYSSGDRFELYRSTTSSSPSYVMKTDAHNDFMLGDGDVVILLSH